MIQVFFLCVAYTTGAMSCIPFASMPVCDLARRNVTMAIVSRATCELATINVGTDAPQGPKRNGDPS